MKLRNHPKLKDWPPVPVGSYTRGTESPPGELDTVKQVYLYPPASTSPANIVLQTEYKGHTFSRYLVLEDAEFAQKLFSRLKQEADRAVEEFGDLDVDF